MNPRTNAILESIVHDTVEKIEAGKPIEDNRIELKSNWPDDEPKWARQLAAHANASRGNNIIWLIGVDEKKGCCGVEFREFSAFWASIERCFEDQVAPNPYNLKVNVKDKTVIVVNFICDRVPYVVKNSKGGQIASEIPFRYGNDTRTIKRVDLLRLLTSSEPLPFFELVNGTVSCYPHDASNGASMKRLECDLSIFAISNRQSPLVIPFYRCHFMIYTERNVQMECDSMRITEPPSLSAFAGAPRSNTIEVTGHEAVIHHGGMMRVLLSHIYQGDVLLDSESLILKGILELPLENRPVELASKFIKSNAAKGAIARWEFRGNG